jgi:hypothetical protein
MGEPTVCNIDEWIKQEILPEGFSVPRVTFKLLDEYLKGVVVVSDAVHRSTIMSSCFNTTVAFADSLAGDRLMSNKVRFLAGELISVCCPDMLQLNDRLRILNELLSINSNRWDEHIDKSNLIKGCINNNEMWMKSKTNIRRAIRTLFAELGISRPESIRTQKQCSAAIHRARIIAISKVG